MPEPKKRWTGNFFVQVVLGCASALAATIVMIGFSEMGWFQSQIFAIVHWLLPSLVGFLVAGLVNWRTKINPWSGTTAALISLPMNIYFAIIYVCYFHESCLRQALIRDFGLPDSLLSCHRVMHALAILLIASISSAREIRLARSDTATLEGTRLVYLGRDLPDSGYILLTASDKSWIHAFPAITPQRPAGTFGFDSHEGRRYHVMHATPDSLLLDRSDTAVPPFLLPAAYSVLDGLQASLALQVREHHHLFEVTGMTVASDGTKDVTFRPTYNGTPEPRKTLLQGQSFRFHEVTLTVLAVAQTGTSGRQSCILGFSPIHAAAIRPNKPAVYMPSIAKSTAFQHPLFPHPNRSNVLVGLTGRTVAR